MESKEYGSQASIGNNEKKDTTFKYNCKNNPGATLQKQVDFHYLQSKNIYQTNSTRPRTLNQYLITVSFNRQTKKPLHI